MKDNGVGVVIVLIAGAIGLELVVPPLKRALGPYADPIAFALLGAGFALVSSAVPEVKEKHATPGRGRASGALLGASVVCWMSAGALVGVPMQRASSAGGGAIAGLFLAVGTVLLASKIAGVEKGRPPPPRGRLAVAGALGGLALIGALVELWSRT
jgi:hypothetical protein